MPFPFGSSDHPRGPMCTALFVRSGASNMARKGGREGVRGLATPLKKCLVAKKHQRDVLWLLHVTILLVAERHQRQSVWREWAPESLVVAARLDMGLIPAGG